MKPSPFFVYGLQKGDSVIDLCVLVHRRILSKIKHTESETLTEYILEEIIMALSNLFGWNKQVHADKSAACGTACGAGDKPAEKPAACGSACGAGDNKPAEKPAACGSACGAGDKQ